MSNKGKCIRNGNKPMPNGYTKTHFMGKEVYAHRLAYEKTFGKIPKGLVIDHLCRNRFCINPNHLEAVTQAVNCQRGDTGKVTGDRNRAKTHCPKNHEYSPTNTYFSKRGRICRTCTNLAGRVRRLNRKELAYV